jgi:hypothetical protein
MCIPHSFLFFDVENGELTFVKAQSIAMGNSIDKIADKFYISSVEPLGDKRRIDDLGVTHILNGAEEHLYRQHGGRLQGITYKVMGWDDAVGQIILPQLRDAADFIEQVADLLQSQYQSLMFYAGYCWRWYYCALRCGYIPKYILLPFILVDQEANVAKLCVQTRVGCSRERTPQPGFLEAASHA